MQKKLTLKRKRMKKLLMSLGIGRNLAEHMARASKQINALALVHPEAVSYESRLFEQRLEKYILLRNALRRQNTPEGRRRMWNEIRFSVYGQPADLRSPMVRLDYVPKRLEGKSPNVLIMDYFEHWARHQADLPGV